MSNKFNPPMKLAELVEAYIVSRPGLKAASIKQYRYTLHSLENRLQRKAAVTDLMEEVINSYIAWRLTEFSPATAKRDRKLLIAWRGFAARQNLLPSIPGFDPPVKSPQRKPTAPIVDDGEPITSQNASAATVAKLLVMYGTKRKLTANTQSYHRSTLKALERFLERPALLSDLTEQTLGDYVAWRAETRAGNTAAQKDRVNIRAWWRFAADEDWLPSPPLTKRAGKQQASAGCLSEFADAVIPAAVTDANNGDISTLEDAVAWYCEERLALSSDSTVRQLVINVRRLRNYLGRSPTIHDLTNEIIRQSMARMIKVDGLAPRTANKFRDNMLAIWRFLAQRGKHTTWPDVKPVVEPRRVPTAWTREQLAKLWAACDAQRGFIGKIKASLWWHTLHAVAWDTGERISGLLSIHRDDVDIERQCVVIRAEGRKGGRDDKISRLHRDTVEVLKALISPERPTLFPWPYHHCYLWTKYKVLLYEAGLPNDRQHKFHCLRKSVASYFEAAGGSATDALGHSDSRITKRHYIDPRIVVTQSASDLLFRPGDETSVSDTRKRDVAANSVKGTRDAGLARLVEAWATLPAETRANILQEVPA